MVGVGVREKRGEKERRREGRKKGKRERRKDGTKGTIGTKGTNEEMKK
jgi:hypothetical protein